MYVIWPIPLKPQDLGGEPSRIICDAWSETAVYSQKDRAKSADGRAWEAAITSYTLPSGEKIENVANDPSSQSAFYIPYGSSIEPEGYIQPNPTAPVFWWVGADTLGIVKPQLENAFKLLYTPIYQKTEVEDGILLNVSPAFSCDAIALFGLEASSVEVHFAGYSSTRSNTDLNGAHRPHLAFLDMPLYTPGDEKITIAITAGSSGIAKCGYLCMGRLNKIGYPTYSLNLGMMDYSHKERDEFGNIEVIKRDFSQLISYNAWVKTEEINQLKRLMSQLRNIPAAYIAHPDLEESLTIGFYRDFSINITDYDVSLFSLEVEGLV